MRGLKIMSWFYTIFFLSFTICSLEARSNKKLHSAVVVGSVYCDTCLQEDFSKSSHFISGASVAVECKDETSKPSFRQEVKTDEHGEFKVHLLFSVSKHVRRIKSCSVKLISSSEPYCAVASSATSSSLRLKSRNEGTHIFSAGFFSFKPLKQPNLCYQKPSLENSEKFNTKKASFPPADENTPVPPPLQGPTMPGLPPLDPSHLPPLPLLPGLPPLPQLPPLPPLPPLPGLPYLPLPFLPPPLLPPNPIVPPPSPIIPLPPVPGLTPPSPPSFPIPLPPVLPSPPPRIPGIPPASSSP